MSVAAETVPAAGGTELLVSMSDIEADRELNVRDDSRRKTEEGAYGDIDTLAADLNTNGQLQAVMVRPSKKTAQKFELIFGFRRYAAAKKIGWKTIRAQIVDWNDAQTDWARLRENEARHNLSSYEKSVAYHKQHKLHGWSIADLAARSGSDKSTVENHVRVMRDCIQDVIDRYRVGQFNNTLCGKLAARTKEQQKDFVEGCGTRAGQFALESFREFEKLGFTWKGADPDDDTPDPSKPEPVKSTRPGKAAQAKAFDWAKENKFYDVEHVLGWVLGKKGYGGSKLEYKGKVFDPKAKTAKPEASNKDE